MTNWNKYLNKKITCSCGREHRCDIKHVEIGCNVIGKLTEYIQEENFKKICIVADVHTIKVAGEQVSKALGNIPFDKYIFPNEELIPDELSIGKLVAHIPNECDFIIGIGSGVINDLLRLVEKKMHIPYAIVATAPSMDGYASAVSPLIIDGFKITYEGLGFPWAIIADLNILRNAPTKMIASGVGDIFGKYICLVEWKLSHLVNDEYYCPEIEKLMRASVDAVAKAADDGIAERTPEGIGAVMEALLWAGIGISYCGNSRPASGCEHQIGHFWEMMFLQNYHRHDIEHGTFVGVAAIISLHIYKEALRILGNNEFIDAHFDKGKWERKVNEVYGACSKSILNLENKAHKNDDEKMITRRKAVLAKKSEIISLIKTLPDSKKLINSMKKIHEPYLPSQIDITPELLWNAIVYAKEMRNRYGVLQLLFDFGKLEEVANNVCKQIEELQTNS